MQFKEPEGDIIVVDRAYVRAEIAEEIARYESQGYAFRFPADHPACPRYIPKNTD